MRKTLIVALSILTIFLFFELASASPFLTVYTKDDGQSLLKDVNITIRNATSGAIITSNVSSYNGLLVFDLPSYSGSDVNVSGSRGSFFPNTTKISISGDQTFNITLNAFNFITVSETQTLEQLYTRYSNSPFGLITNNSGGSAPCRYTINEKSIEIYNNADLNLNNCVMEIDSSVSGGSGITLFQGGGFSSYNGNLSAVSLAGRYYFQARSNSRLNLTNFYSYGLGTPDTQCKETTISGLLINTTQTTLNNVTMLKGADSSLIFLTGGINASRLNLLGNNGAGSAHIYGIYVCNSNGGINVFDSNISGNSLRDIVLIAGQNITIINTLHTTDTVNSGASLIRKWYLDVAVNRTGSFVGIPNVNVSAYNNLGSLQFSKLTAVNGQIETQTLTEYINLAGTKTYYSNYSINATWNSNLNSTSVNMSTNRFVQFFFTRSPPIAKFNDGKMKLSTGTFFLRN